MEEYASGGVPFDSLWETFQNQFKAQFETMNEAMDAKEKLHVLWQGSSTVPEYAALFKELMTCTSYSSTDLQDCFYKHLSTRIKNELVHTTRPISSLDQLITVATDLDVHIHQRQAERDRERKHTGAATGSTTMHPPPSNISTPFIPLTADPIAMDINTTCTCKEFMRQMHGKCLGCGSTIHSKKDGHHDCDLCAYCKCGDIGKWFVWISLWVDPKSKKWPLLERRRHQTRRHLWRSLTI